MTKTLPERPDANVNMLVHKYGLTTKDALTLLSFDDGDRLDYFLEVVRLLLHETMRQEDHSLRCTLGKVAGDWYYASPDIISLS